MSNFKGANCHFSIKTAPLTAITMDDAVDKLKDVLKTRFFLDEVARVPLNDGSMIIFSAPAIGENPTLSATARLYGSESLISINLEGTGPLNTPSVENSFNFVSGSDSKGINNNSMDRLRVTLTKSLGVDVDKVPVLKIASDVPVYFTSCDDRIFEYDFDKLLFDGTSEYQQVRIYRSPTLGNALFLDDLQNLAECDIQYTRGLMHYGFVDYKDKDILILGGGDGGLLNELLKEKPKHVTMVDIDQMVIDACREHLRLACDNVLDILKKENYHVIVGDCIKFMQECINTGRQFDVVFNDLTDIPLSPENSEAGSDLWGFVKNVLNMALQCLKKDGKYLNHAIGTGCTTALEAYEGVLQALPTKVTYTRHTAFVPSFYEDWVFYELTKL